MSLPAVRIDTEEWASANPSTHSDLTDLRLPTDADVQASVRTLAKLPNPTDMNAESQVL